MSVKSSELRSEGYGAFRGQNNHFSFSFNPIISFRKITFSDLIIARALMTRPFDAELSWTLIERIKFYFFMFGQHVDICVSMPAKLAIPLSMFFCWHVLQPNCRCFTRPITDHYERNNGTNLLCDQTVTLSQFSFFFGILSSRFLLFASQYELVGLLSIGNLFILFFL